MKWVSRDKWLTWGFVHQTIGGPATGQVWTICHHSRPLCGRFSVATASAVAIVCQDSMAHIFIAEASVGAATETNWYIQGPALFGSHDTFQTEEKKGISVCWKSWENLGLHGDCAAKAAMGH